MLVKENEKSPAQTSTAPALRTGRNDPFVYFANVIRGNIKMDKYDLSPIENNEIVVKILEAARYAAKNGKTVLWNDFYKRK